MNIQADPELKEMNYMGKSLEDIKFRSLIKEKLKVTKIPKLILVDKNDTNHYFNEYY
jgi:hypothetical protein